MKKLLIITPHLSTGGAPQVTANKVELLLNHFHVKVVEHAFIAWSFVVQRNKIISLVGNKNFHSLGENKLEEIKSILEDFQPDVISMEEIPEMFCQGEFADYLYRNDRPYTILETTHDSSFNIKNKFYRPDKYVFVSPYSAFQYIDTDVPIEIIEYPVDRKYSDKSSAKVSLGLDESYYHIIIVGLFTPRKNQKYAFELAHKLHKHRIKFHFLGNQAGNFESYWKPLMDWKASTNELDNVVVWGERDDVPRFVHACDMFLFCSKGERTNKELNPIAIKEAMEYEETPKLMFNLDVYSNKYNESKNVHFLSGELDTDANKILDIFKIDASSKDDELIVVGTYPNLDERLRLTKECINRLKKLNRKILLVSHYPVDFETQKLVDYYIYDSHNPLTHHSYYIKFYNHTHNYDADININALKNSNQSLTVLTNLFNSAKFCKQNGFNKFFYITFDVLVSPEDFYIIDESFKSINETNKAFLGSLNTPFGKGIQTNGMTFDADYFMKVFHDVREPNDYNNVCSVIGSQNFLEDYMIKCLNKKDVDGLSYTLIHNEEETFLKNSGLGTSSNSEYYSILPIRGEDNHFMFYFFSYNLDERKINITIHEDDNEIFNTRFQVNKSREYKKDFYYSGRPITFLMEFYDGERVYKTEKYIINSSNIENYKNTGYFLWKNKKPRIKLVHIQVTKDDERQQQSRQSMERVRDYGWEYILHTNKPYGDLPPKYNCIRPNCVSYELFDEQRVQELGTALTPAHYGCYEAFKNGILSEFDSDVDFLIMCEGDCIIETPIDHFVNIVEKSCQHLIDNNIGYMSFGDKETLEHGWLQSPVVEEIPNQDFMYITNHIIGLQCIMFPHFVRDFLKDMLRRHNWDAADIYFNVIMHQSGTKFGIVKERLTTQADGFSLIDNTYKSFRKK